MSTYGIDTCNVTTYKRDMSDPKALGAIGHSSQIVFSSQYPGGDYLASGVLQIPPQLHTSALDYGRIVRIFRGITKVWEGDLDGTIVQQADGWHWQAHGLGSMGDDYTYDYTTWDLNSGINSAIADRGLRWKNPGISDGWLDVAPQSDSLTVTDFLVSITSRKGLGYFVQRDGTLDVATWPTEVNRLLVSTTPIPRTLMKDINKMWILYQSGTVGGTGATAGNPIMSKTSVENTAAANKVGHREEYLDLSMSGVISEGVAQSGGQFLLNQYGRAMWTGSFQIHNGSLLTMGGVPVDLPMERASSVCRLLISDSLIGEVNAGTVSFVSGLVEYDVDAGVLSVTPYNSYRNDLMAVIAATATSAVTKTITSKYTTAKTGGGGGYGGGGTGGATGSGLVYCTSYVQTGEPLAAVEGDLWSTP